MHPRVGAGFYLPLCLMGCISISCSRPEFRSFLLWTIANLTYSLSSHLDSTKVVVTATFVLLVRMRCLGGARNVFLSVAWSVCREFWTLPLLNGNGSLVCSVGPPCIANNAYLVSLYESRCVNTSLIRVPVITPSACPPPLWLFSDWMGISVYNMHTRHWFSQWLLTCGIL